VSGQRVNEIIQTSTDHDVAINSDFSIQTIAGALPTFFPAMTIDNQIAMGTGRLQDSSWFQLCNGHFISMTLLLTY
jgi:hypothetical protein